MHQQPDLWVRRAVHEISQGAKPHTVKQKRQDRSFDIVRVKYIGLDSMTAVIFTKLGVYHDQRGIWITYKIDSRANGNLMPFKIFKFQVNNRSTASHKTSALVLKTYNISNIEQWVVCSVTLRNKEKVARCRYFIVLADGPVLLGILDIELLSILKITGEMMEDQQGCRKSDPRTLEPTGALN